MGRTVTYFIVALAIILGLTYMATQAESCAKKQTPSIHVNDLSADRVDNQPQEDLEDDDDYEPVDEHNDATGSILSDVDAEDEKVIPIEGDEPEYQNNNTSTKINRPTESSNVPQDENEYLVIAGAFKSEPNAEKEVEKLKNMGYPNAEIVEFDFSDFYSVCVARYENSNDAEKVANSIKNRLGKKAYVHKKRNKE